MHLKKQIAAALAVILYTVSPAAPAFTYALPDVFHMNEWLKVERFVNGSFTSTKVIVTKNYTEELVRHITNALTIAFG